MWSDLGSGHSLLGTKDQITFNFPRLSSLLLLLSLHLHLHRISEIFWGPALFFSPFSPLLLGLARLLNPADLYHTNYPCMKKNFEEKL